MQCWCKSNGDEKAKSIEEAQNHVKALEARVDELTATSSRLTSEITHTEDEVSSNEKALEASEALRAKQVTEFAADEKDLTQSATSVDNALGVIGTSQSSFLQTSNRRVANALTQLKIALSKHDRLFTKAQRSDVEFLQTSLETPGAVEGLLTGLKDSFEVQLSDLKKQETEDKKAHEGLVKAKTEEIQAGKKQLEAKKEQKASADLEKEQSKQDIRDTTAALEADGAVSTEVKEKCAVMDTDYDKAQQVAIWGASCGQQDHWGLDCRWGAWCFRQDLLLFAGVFPRQSPRPCCSCVGCCWEEIGFPPDHLGLDHEVG